MAGHPQLAVPSTTRLAVSRSPRALRTLSDRQLVALTRGGAKEAYETIVGRYRAPLLRYCRRLLGPDRAEDVVQDTFAKAYTALQGSTGEIQVRAWLYRIAHNTAVTELRDNDWHHGQLKDEEQRHATVAGPEVLFERSEHLRRVVDSIRRLPSGQRQAIVLRELEGRSYDDIAVDLRTSRGSAHQLVRRARARLRAAAIMIIPPDLLARVPWAPLREAPAPLAALTAGGGASALAKAGAVVLAAGAVAAGVSTGQGGGPDAPTPAPSGGAPPAPSVEAVATPAGEGGVRGGSSDGQFERPAVESSRSGDDSGSSGHGGGGSGQDSGSSGHGGGGSGQDSGSSGHGSSGSGSGVELSPTGSSEGSSGGDSGSSGSSTDVFDSSGSGADGGDGSAVSSDSSGETGSGGGGEGSG